MKNNKNLFYSILFMVLITSVSGAQNMTTYRSPLDIPLSLSGTFGELRSNHFHSGIDIRTEGRIGLPIYAIADGYVSRISIGAFGFGHAVYIDHPETGHTSVYAHLDELNEQLTAYIRKQQYQQQSFEVNIYLQPGEIPVSKGTVIANSGNSGSSGGPHLHFEIRRSSDQHPLNPLLFGFEVADESAPVIDRIKFFPVDQHGAVMNFNDEAGYPVRRISDGQYVFERDVLALGHIGFAVETFDRQSGSWNKNGVYGVELYVDDRIFYRQVFDEFAFSETRYCNATTNYEAYQCCRRKFYNGVRLPQNKLKMLQGQPSFLDVEPGMTYNMRFEVFDLSGNRSILSFTVIGDKRLAAEFTPLKAEKWMAASQTNTFRNRHVDVFMPLDVLYQDIYFEYNFRESSSHDVSDIHQIHQSTTAAHSRYVLGIRPKKEILNENQLFLARVSNSGGFYGLEKAELKGDYAYAKVRSFGAFQLVLDTVAPVIQPVNFWDGQRVGNRTFLQFRAFDELSGIESYRVEVNNRWVLAEYDGKNDLFTIEISEFIAKGEQNLKFKVVDLAGNIATWQGVVYF